MYTDGIYIYYIHIILTCCMRIIRRQLPRLHFLYIYICEYVHVYLCMYLYMYVYVHAYAYTYV